MPMLPSSFNTKDEVGMDSFEPIPAGKYIAKIVESDMVLTNAAQQANNPDLGQMLKLKFEIISPSQTGRFIFRNLLLVHTNATVVEIAKRELVTISRACGVDVVTDSNQLHGIPIQIDVVIKEPDEKSRASGYGAQNNIKMYESCENNLINNSINNQQQKTKKIFS